jgi:hypothetical protein
VRPADWKVVASHVTARHDDIAGRGIKTRVGGTGVPLRERKGGAQCVIRGVARVTPCVDTDTHKHVSTFHTPSSMRESQVTVATPTNDATDVLVHSGEVHAYFHHCELKCLNGIDSACIRYSGMDALYDIRAVPTRSILERSWSADLDSNPIRSLGVVEDAHCNYVTKFRVHRYLAKPHSKDKWRNGPACAAGSVPLHGLRVAASLAGLATDDEVCFVLRVAFFVLQGAERFCDIETEIKTHLVE